MIFWVLVALVIVITAYCTWAAGYDMHVAGGILALLISSFVACAIWVICSVTMPKSADLVAERTYQLRALGNDSAIHGRSYFLGGGYIGEKRVLNYISQREGGAIKVERADAADSTIYEDAKTALVTVRHFDFNNGWVQTWPLGDGDTYEFHIPSGSVLNDYTVDNK
jgi:hypothetical protein